MCCCDGNLVVALAVVCQRWFLYTSICLGKNRENGLDAYRSGRSALEEGTSPRRLVWCVPHLVANFPCMSVKRGCICACMSMHGCSRTCMVVLHSTAELTYDPILPFPHSPPGYIFTCPCFARCLLDRLPAQHVTRLICKYRDLGVCVCAVGSSVFCHISGYIPGCKDKVNCACECDAI